VKNTGGESMPRIMNPAAGACLAACCGGCGRILFEIPSLGIEDSPELAPEDFNSDSGNSTSPRGSWRGRDRRISERSGAVRSGDDGGRARRGAADLHRPRSRSQFRPRSPAHPFSRDVRHHPRKAPAASRVRLHSPVGAARRRMGTAAPPAPRATEASPP